MKTIAPVAKNRCVRLQQELVETLRATGSIEGAEQFWLRLDFTSPQIKLVRALLLILSLAVRRKGIARCAALHLDCARSAWNGSLSVRVGEAVAVF